MEEMIKIPKSEYEVFRTLQTSVDLNLLSQLVESLNDIKQKRIRRVK